MDKTSASFIISYEGRKALDALAGDEAALDPDCLLATITSLRSRFSPERAAALIETALARQKAVRQAKFALAHRMFFTRQALEQSSSESVSAYRYAAMLGSLDPGAYVADLGCGVGGDSIALAAGFRVTGVDSDEARLTFAQANVDAYGRAESFRGRAMDLREFRPDGFDALYFDPARRDSRGKRIFDVRRYSPPLSLLHEWLPLAPNICVKVSPGVDYRQLAAYDCEVEIISLHGEVKEAVLWFGGFRQRKGPPVSRRATLLPDELSLGDAAPAPRVPCTNPGAFLYEPDGAVIRAGLVEALAERIGATKLDAEISYLTAESLVATRFCCAYEVVDVFPFSLKRLNRSLNALSAGRAVVKKRGSPIEPEQLQRALRLKGDPGTEYVVFLTRVHGQHTAIVCKPPGRREASA